MDMCNMRFPVIMGYQISFVSLAFWLLPIFWTHWTCFKDDANTIIIVNEYSPSV